MAGHNFTPSDFYVYVHRRATDGRVFYVGKGCDRRAFSKRRTTHWKRIAEKYGYIVEIVQDGMQEWWAFELECELIAYYGRDNLCNMTDGGDGLSGMKFSEDHKLKIGNANKGKKMPAHVIEILKKANTGRKLSKDHRDKLSKAKIGKKHSAEHIKNIADKRRGKPHTPEGKINIRKSKCKIIVCLETKEKFFGSVHASEWVKTFNPKASPAAITRVCLGKNHTAYGYTWKYQDENP